MNAYYNEYDKHAAAWLRELIASNLIAPGEVDERSIVDVRADDLRGFTQCHFFAGIGVWSYALRRAGWDDARPIWTASLPCQPFSAAGKGEGHADERHLADVWLRLACECRPAICLGEQVEPAIGYGWLDALFIQLEQSGYACGAAVFPACSVGAPHIRSRLYWMAHALDADRQRGAFGRTVGTAQRQSESEQSKPWIIREATWNSCPTDGMAYAGRVGIQRRGGLGDTLETGRRGDDIGDLRAGNGGGATGLMGDAAGIRSDGLRERGFGETEAAGRMLESARTGAWDDAIWIPCRDGKSRPVGRGISPLVVADAQRTQRRAERADDDNAAQAGWEQSAGGVGECLAIGGQQRSTQPSLEPLVNGPAAGMGRVRYRSTPEAEGGEAAWATPRVSDTAAGRILDERGRRVSASGVVGVNLSDQVIGCASGASADPLNTSEARVMRLRGYGNSLVASAAQAFIEAAMECV